MGVRKMRLNAPCPGCGGRELDYTYAELELPHFGDAQQLLFSCNACGFRHSDFQIGRTRDPTRYTFYVAGPDHVNARVVRSTSGTVRIPELGILIEPGPASDAYVSNVEGVLTRVQAVLEQLLRDADTDEHRQAAEERKRQLEDAREGRLPFTFILEDPYGNSAVLHAEAKVEPLSPGDAAALKSGQITLDVTDADDLPAGGVAPGLGGNGHPDGGDPKAP